MKGQFKNNGDREDQKLIRKAKQGNHKAFGKLVLKYQQQLYYAVRRMILNHDDTNDIVQEAFVKAYTNLERFDESYSFYPWLYRIAINTTLNYQSRAARTRERFAGQEDAASRHSEENPLKQVMQDELQLKVTEALNQLPVEQRVVFVLRTSDELSYQEISEVLDISIGTVMSRLSRARGRLKVLLQDYLSMNNSGV